VRVGEDHRYAVFFVREYELGDTNIVIKFIY